MKKYLVPTTLVLMTALLGFSTYVRALTVDNNFSGQIQNASDFENRIDISRPAAKALPDCRSTGDDKEGATSCKQTLQDGSYATSVSNHEKAWNEFKNQTTISSFDASGNGLGKREVRRKTEFVDDTQKVRTKDSYDIVTFPPGQKITREVLIFEYHTDGKTVSKIYYAKYTQIDDLALAELTYHISLRYDAKGFPLKGKAEHWKGENKNGEFFRWNREVNGLEQFDSAAWKQWEDITKRASLTEALF